ncbi:MAG: c-type cytochrome [Pirellulales bacterium]
MAVAHQGEASDQARVLTALSSIDYQKLSESEKLAWIRALQLVFTRLGEPSDEWRGKLVGKLDALYPAPTYFENAELVQLLIYLKSPTVIEKSLAIMDNLGPEPIPDWGYLVTRNAGYGGTVGKLLENMPPSRAIHFAFHLRNVKSGWTLAQRQKYFEFFVKASKYPGGNSYAKFLVQFRDDAITNCSPAELVVLAPLVGQNLLGEPVASTPPKGPGRKWTTTEALTVVGSGLKKRNHASGRNLFHATSCAKCHRLAGEGGAVGPDLSTAGKKFSMTDMLDAIIEPSKAISDQYGSHQVVLVDGKVLVGRAVEIGEEVYVYTIDADAKPVVLKKADIESLTPSKVSQMPVGLVDTLSAEELKDLLAYIMSAGDPKAGVYK